MPGPVVGKMHQGDLITHSAAQPDEAGAPHRAAQPAPAPRGVQHQKETPAKFGRNPQKAH